MKKARSSNILFFLNPRYWLTGIGLVILYGCAQLPYRTQRQLGRFFGKIAHFFMRRRRHIADVNLTLCFPDWDEKKRKALIRKNFDALGMGLIETGIAWWGSKKKWDALGEIKGAKHLEKAIKKGKGVILLCAHFTTLEIAARIVGKQFPIRTIYREQKNKLFNAVMIKNRKRIVDDIIQRHDTRQMIKSLKENIPLYYAGDQDYGRKHSIFVPFFDIPAATITAIVRLAKLTDASVIPVSHYRLDKQSKYVVNFHPALENFPSDNIENDLLQINQTVEKMIITAPEQYFWIHRRFKTRPAGEKRPY